MRGGDRGGGGARGGARRLDDAAPLRRADDNRRCTSSPETLAWFNGVMASRVAPMVAAQFGVGAAAVRVHDAFLVRYEAGAQALLPMHSDESEVSLTIALNALGEYDGGGTYFADLREAVRPEQGHALAFDGSLFHGGEPIVRGVRYIIAAFLYTERAVRRRAELEEPRPTRRRAGGGAQRRRRRGGGFSFGFSVNLIDARRAARGRSPHSQPAADSP